MKERPKARLANGKTNPEYSRWYSRSEKGKAAKRKYEKKRELMFRCVTCKRDYYLESVQEGGVHLGGGLCRCKECHQEWKEDHEII